MRVIHQELKRKGVTLQLLWEEYEKAHGQSAYRYSQFCLHYHEYRGRLARSMRQVHRAGEKVFIDYSGDTVAVIDAKSGEILTAEIFVATLGASKYAYAEATWTQTLPDWIGSKIRMLEFFGSVPSLWIPDNLKAAIRKACRYEPEATSTYQDCASHYGAAILPARPYHAKDKASVEMSVLVVQRWILARLRNRQFFSLRELNPAIAELLTDLNRRPFKKLPGSRLTAFESIDRPAMKPLPPTRYEYAEWSKAKVGIDYHAEGGSALLQRAAHAGRRARHGAPHRHDGRMLLQGPPRCRPRAQLPEGQAYDAARAHAECASQTHEMDAGAALNWGQNIGAGTRAVVQWQLENRPHPEQGYRACLGLAEPVQDLRRGAPGGGLPPGARHRRPASQTHHRDPQSQARSASGPLSRGRHGGCHGLAHARQRARRRLLP